MNSRIVTETLFTLKYNFILQCFKIDERVEWILSQKDVKIWEKDSQRSFYQNKSKIELKALNWSQQ